MCVRPIGDNIDFCPPLNTEEKHLDEVFGIVAEVVRELKQRHYKTRTRA